VPLRKPARPLPYEPPQLRYTYLGKYVLTADFVVEVGGRRFTIPAGAVTDLATTPRLMWVLLPPIGIYEAAATAHDWWCAEGISQGELTSREADAFFRDMMGEAGVGFCTRWAMWAAVRVAAPRNVKRRPSGIAQDLPFVLPIGLLAVAVTYAVAVGADRLAHFLRLL
jgi:hypothetical protein